MRTARDGEFDELTGDALREPILPGIVYTPFDLQMPFLYWEDYNYEGPACKEPCRAKLCTVAPEGYGWIGFGANRHR